MLESVVFVPSAPLLVPELAGPAAIDTVAVRDATLAGVRSAARHAATWLAIGAADDPTTPTCAELADTGTFLRYGVDVGVSLGGGRSTTDAGHHAGTRLPLSMLIAAWVRGQVELAQIHPCVIAADAPPEECAAVGRQIATAIDSEVGPVSVLVVADGAFALSPKAPGGGLRESAVRLQEQIDKAIAVGDVDALTALDVADCVAEGVAGRPAWQVTAELCRGRRIDASTDYAAAPFGVGYTVATWRIR